VTRGDLLQQVGTYYSEKLAAHGATPRGVDWNSHDGQILRLKQLLRLLDDEQRPVSVNDYGCGYGALVGLFRDHPAHGAYCGFDVSEAMIESARALWGETASCRFVTRRDELSPADYTMASGIFNVRLDVPTDRWHSYVLETIDDLAALSRRGFGFNVLTAHADPERRRQDLYYADPIELFEYCRRRFSRRIALLHDSPLFEFTMLVRH
jgi:SAM-dependent methyltransferase